MRLGELSATELATLAVAIYNSLSESVCEADLRALNHLLQLLRDVINCSLSK